MSCQSAGCSITGGAAPAQNPTKETDVTDPEAMGPVDYIVIEWPGDQPTGEAAPLLLDLVDRGLVRILDLVFITKGDDGSIAALEIGELPDEFAEFDGARSGLFSDEDLEEAATVLDPGTSAAVLVWENRWAAPFAVALRQSGAQLVASGRIPIQALIAAAEGLE